jgi:hypothetical protein
MAFKAPSSAIEVCNLALTQLKQDFIVQLDPPSSMAEKYCALAYHQIRRSCLRKHTWNFAMKRIVLTPTSDVTPEFGYTHAYALPPNFIRFAGRYDEAGNVTSFEDYEIEDGYLLYNGEDNGSLNLRYVYDHQIVAKFDPLFLDFFVVCLAIALAPKFTGTENRQAALLKAKADIESEAKSVDGQERPPRRKQQSKWLASRRRGMQGGGADLYTRFG